MPENGADGIFSYENLPSKHWKKYIYAVRFVNLVKGKTPKITYYSVEAKCQLMESLDDFEVCFYNGAKVTKSANDQVKMINENGCVINIDDNILMGTAKNLYDHYEECQKHCQSVERSLNGLNTNGSCFPIIIGRRPNQDVQGRESSNLLYSTPRSHMVIKILHKFLLILIDNKLNFLC